MNTPKPKLPKIVESERTPLVDVLLELLAWQSQRIDELEQEEILKLKNETLKPIISATQMDKQGEVKKELPEKEIKPKKISKAKLLRIDETVVIQPENIPTDSVFKGFREVVSKILFSRPTTRVIG